MAKDEQEEAYDRVLTASLSRTLDLIKFAEAKNGALLTFCSAWAFGLVNVLTSNKNLPAHFPTPVKVALVLFVLAGLICIASLLPKLDPRTFHKKRAAGLNLLFFGDLAAVPVSMAASALKKYLPDTGRSASDAYLEDLASQIAINSRIAAQKYSTFTLSAYLVVAAFFVLVYPEGAWVWDRISPWLNH